MTRIDLSQEYSMEADKTLAATRANGPDPGRDRRPTVEELAAFLEETQRHGMNPAAQADHLRQHYPDCVREEGSS